MPMAAPWESPPLEAWLVSSVSGLAELVELEVAWADCDTLEDAVVVEATDEMLEVAAADDEVVTA